MKANEAVRFHCGDCQIIFELCVQGERATEDAGGDPPVIDYGEPSSRCPFCGADELTRVSDDAIVIDP